ncbi:2-amino-4-hydroxy-6-hydroxymethyldihydropteridine diphosphokinase [Saccharobesus litoralis]|uniref:2-amino-4-hydroxy-6-hydroxymethyldihydropteridine pyrophosphokinase n=1 Tax=Saccharobesus litoralis TaxID=2172099 RepID=A0A2S0VS49_9ALTE|nr:2-amino-4-hydroxy-6-hydroxymethyldihydropteridine diphosphokinase [Saccharobesus litoralis]AWB67041.1 2-amino-4-hydroxy-6-hydroxymethyldihydropteridine diphosphokinase [Saccharobesus litoralis]
MITVYLGLGSNLATPIEQLNHALQAIAQLDKACDLSCSSFYESLPMGPQDQPNYVNAVACLTWQGEAIELLNALQNIELTQGRVRKAERWGPRTLDIDILLYGEQTINHPRLIVPHYGMYEREFVLYPLAEIAPNLILPSGQPISALLKACAINGLKKLN